MNVILLIIQILVSVILMTLILLQSSKGGLGGALGGGELYRTKRGAERIVFTTTIVVAFIFLIVSLLNVALR
ncbi:MAG TPA: preprotein translocase subunit SecG [Patescibacteria group bacterium]|nr:preprotein translocase subunit SecG [Patescibacteria group bacterium]